MTATLEGLYAVTPDRADSAALLSEVERALAGGVRLLQYRNKSADAALRAEQARSLLDACRRHGARLIVNDDWQLAAAIGAHGAHLGRDDGDVAAARAALGPRAILGVSCYGDLARARKAQGRGADYVAFGSVFASATKPAAPRAPLDLLARGRRELAVPIAAIGGITLDNAPLVLAAGADLLAVITDLFGAADIASRARAYGELWACAA